MHTVLALLLSALVGSTAAVKFITDKVAGDGVNLYFVAPTSDPCVIKRLSISASASVTRGADGSKTSSAYISLSDINFCTGIGNTYDGAITPTTLVLKKANPASGSVTFAGTVFAPDGSSVFIEADAAISCPSQLSTTQCVNRRTDGKIRSSSKGATCYTNFGAAGAFTGSVRINGQTFEQFGLAFDYGGLNSLDTSSTVSYPQF